MKKTSKKVIGFVVLLVAVLTLSACDSTVEVKLYVDDTLYGSISDVSGGTFMLDTVEKENMIFTGWEHEGKYYLSDAVFEKSMELHATFAEVEDLFDTHLDGNHIYLSKFTGTAKIMVIPQYIDGKLVTSMSGNTFDTVSYLEEIHIPADVVLQSYAFMENEFLRRVEYYGERVAKDERNISSSQYDDILQEYPNVCEIVTTNEDNTSWTFKEGCPIHKIISVSETIVIGGAEFFTYNALMDQKYVDELQFIMMGSVFRDCPNLETIVLPDHINLMPESFEGCDRLEHIIFSDENKNYMIEDGIVYNYDKTDIIFIIPAYERDTLILDETVDYVHMHAFLAAPNLKTIKITSDFTERLNFMGLNGLEKFELVGENDFYTVVDGVLYHEDELIKYPAKKSGSVFVIPTRVTKINSRAFEGVVNVRDLTITENVEYIADYSFYRAQSITSITIPENVEVLGGGSFMESSIREIRFLRDESIEGNVTAIWHALLRNPEGLEIFVPDTAYDAYMSGNIGTYHGDYIKKESER